MQKLCCVRTRQRSLQVWIISSQVHHRISTNSQPFLMGIVSKTKKENPKKSKQSMKKQVASLVEAALNRVSQSLMTKSTMRKKYIMSMVQAAVTKTLEQKSDQKSQEKTQSPL